MSCFVHDEKELNILGKYLKEELKVEKNLADHIINPLTIFSTLW